MQTLTDRLSQLPDELTINIISRLTPQESGRTCVLSHRWKNLWLLSCSGPNLIFEDHRIFEFSSLSVKRKGLLFVGLLNKAIQFVQQELLDELVIASHLTSISSITVDNWIRFALTKGVQRLELALSLCDSGIPYAFPSLQNENFRGFGVHRLRALCLKGIDVDQTALDSLFSTCPLLDSLSLKQWKLANLNFSSVKLKHLELSCLDSNNSIKRYEIYAPNLVTFVYKGKVSALCFNCIACLSEFHVRDQDHLPFFMDLDKHLSYIDRLKKLKLNLGVMMCLNLGTFYPLDLPLLMNLEEFEVEFNGFDGDSFLWPTIFIKASPFLSRFSVKMDVISSCSAGIIYKGDKRRIKEVTKFRHEFLKVVEISGFKGRGSEIELAQHLIDIGAQSLQKVVINTRYDRGGESTKMCAQSLGQGLDSSVEFVVR